MRGVGAHDSKGEEALLGPSRGSERVHNVQLRWTVRKIHSGESPWIKKDAAQSNHKKEAATVVVRGGGTRREKSKGHGARARAVWSGVSH